MTEQRISDDELRIIRHEHPLRIPGDKLRALVLDLLDARAALRLREQGGAWDDAAIREAGIREFPGESETAAAQRWAFRLGAMQQSQQPAPAPPSPSEPDVAMRAAMNICHDLHEGGVPGCGKELSLADMQATREFIASIIRQQLPASAPTYRDRLRDEFALAFVAAGRDEKDAYKLADVAMKVRDAMECRDTNQPARVP